MRRIVLNKLKTADPRKLRLKVKRCLCPIDLEQLQKNLRAYPGELHAVALAKARSRLLAAFTGSWIILGMGEWVDWLFTLPGMDVILNHPILATIALALGPAVGGYFLVKRMCPHRPGREPRGVHAHRFRPDGPWAVEGNDRVRVRRRYMRRVRSRWSCAKRWCAVWIWRVSMPRGVARSVRAVEPRLLQLIRRAKFCIIKPERTLLFGAVAGRCIGCRGRLLLGYETIIGERWAPLRDTALDHELVHCVQEIADNIMTRESWGRVRVGLGFWVELHAMFCGSSLLPIGLLSAGVGAALWFSR